MRFCLLHGNTQVKDMRVQYKPLIWYIEAFYSIVFFGIKYMFFISGKRCTKVYIIAVASKTIPVIRHYLNGPFINFFQYA